MPSEEAILLCSVAIAKRCQLHGCIKSTQKVSSKYIFMELVNVAGVQGSGQTACPLQNKGGKKKIPWASKREEKKSDITFRQDLRCTLCQNYFFNVSEGH